MGSTSMRFNAYWTGTTQLYTGDRTAAAAMGLAAARATVDAVATQNLTVDRTTLVLPVTKRDFERFLVLLASLHRFLDPTVSVCDTSSSHHCYVFSNLWQTYE
jgi:hypothetical protein